MTYIYMSIIYSYESRLCFRSWSAYYLPVTGERQTLNIGRSAHFLLQGLLCAWRNPHLLQRVSKDSMFVWISLNSCPLNFLLVRSLQIEIIITKCLIQGRNNVTRCELKPNHAIRVHLVHGFAHNIEQSTRRGLETWSNF